MVFGRCVVKKVMPHNEFVHRIRKSLYFGTGVEEMQLSLPLASYASELFSKSHKDYSLNRLSTYNAGKIQASPCSLIMALIFLERLNATDPGYVRRITPQELFIVSMMISTKFYIGYDEEIYLSDWATEGNMSEERLKKLEIEFLCAINWKIYISNEEFFNKLTDIEKALAQREGLRRGWLTYTELTQTMPSMRVTRFLLNALLNHITVMLVSYAAGVLTIVGAFFLASQIPGHMLHRNRAETRNTLSADTTGDMINASNDTAFGDLELVAANRTSMSTVLERHNATCGALNVEEELSKLDRQYAQEQAEEDKRSRNNEINHVPYLVLPMRQSQIPLQSEKQQHKWLSFKEMYSDKRCDSRMNLFGERINFSTSAYSNEMPKYFIDCLKDIRNCTLTLFWQMLSSAQQSNVHLPLLWFKFI